MMSMMRRSLLPTLMVVVGVAMVLVLMNLQAYADAILNHDQQPKWQLLNQTAFGRKANAGGSKKRQLMSGYMSRDSENGGSGDEENSSSSSNNNSGNNSALHLNNHHYFMDPRKLPPRY